MSKIKAVMELYKQVFPHVTLTQRGTWINVSQGFYAGKNANLHTPDLLEEIFAVSGEEWEWDEYYGILRRVVNYDPKDSWNTNDSWNTKEWDWDTKKPMSKDEFYAATEQSEVEENLFEDIGEV